MKIEVELVQHACWCGTPHMVSTTLLRRYHDERMALHCPLGHQYLYAGEKESERMTRELKRSKEIVEELRDETRKWQDREYRLKAALLRSRALVRELRAMPSARVRGGKGK